jgi:hypothetical protein
MERECALEGARDLVSRAVAPPRRPDCVLQLSETAKLKLMKLLYRDNAIAGHARRRVSMGKQGND